MAFSGDLEHLSIVDVIQLLHTTRKTGTLKVTGRKGAISIAFSDGYITGASHYERGARIGTILVEAGVITADALGQALHIQDLAGESRKPLIATLLENGLADHESAYRGLETLIELAIVEILTWKKGHFELLVDEIQVCDEFRYFPNNLHEEITMPTEHVLMDALRIFDEKMRDGLLKMEDDQPDDAPPQGEPQVPAPDNSLLSADDLGLGDLDGIRRKIPGVFEAIKDHGGAPAQQKTQSANWTAIFRNAAERLQKAATMPETAGILLETVAAVFPRALTLVVWETDLVAEKGVGITVSGSRADGVLGFRIPRTSGTLFNFVLEKGRIFHGKSSDQGLQDYLYPHIVAPADPTILLLPLKMGNRIISLTYADFGSQPAAEIPLQQLQSCAEHAGIAIESALLKSQAGK